MLRLLFVILVPCLFINNITGQSNFFVATNGNNTNNGLAENTAWRTISHAVQNIEDLYPTTESLPEGGIIIYVKAGEYRNEHLTFDIDGEDGKPIVLKGYKNELDEIPNIVFSSSDDITSLLFYEKMPLLNGVDTTGRAIDLTERRYIRIENFLIANYGEGIFSQDNCENISIDNVIAKTFGTLNCADTLDQETKEPYCGFGIVLHGNNSKIKNSIVMNAGAENLACWGNNNYIGDCKSLGDNLAINTTDYYIFIQNGNNNIIERCTVNRIDDPIHKGHGIGIINGSFNKITDCISINTREGFYVRVNAHYNIFKGCKTSEMYEDGRQSEFPAVHIRDGASYNQFINCHFKNANIGVRILGSNLLDVDNDNILGIGTGHHNLFYNCIFEKAKAFIVLWDYKSEDCQQLNNCSNCESLFNPSLCSDCTNSSKSCLDQFSFEEGGNIFSNCIFIGANKAPIPYGNLIVTDQEPVNQPNKIINSIIYQVNYFRACRVDGSSYDSHGTCPEFFPTFIPLNFEFQNNVFWDNTFQDPNGDFKQNFHGLPNNNSSLILDDPQFINYSSEDYHISSSSPAINTGLNPSVIINDLLGQSLAEGLPFFDYENSPRPIDCRFDIGLYEYNTICNNEPTNSIDCNTELVLNIELEGYYTSKATLETNGIVEQGKSVTMLAGESVTLKNGFHAKIGSDFIAKIETCDNGH